MRTRTREIALGISIVVATVTSALSAECADGLTADSPVKEVIACLKTQAAALAELRQNSGNTLPIGAIIAFDDPGTCAKLGSGWADGTDFVGKTLVGAGSSDPRWAYRKSGGSVNTTINAANIPPLYLGYHTAQSGPGVTLSLVEQLSFTLPNSPNILRTSTASAIPIDIMPPYVPIYFCKRTS